jgi:hypothetical protein
METAFDRLATAADTGPVPSEPILARRRHGAPILLKILPVHGAASPPFLNARALILFSSLEPNAQKNQNRCDFRAIVA